MPTISQLNTKANLSISAVILIALSLIALWLIITGPLTGLKKYADKNWNYLSPFLTEPQKEEAPKFKKGEQVWWYDQEYKGTGIITAIDAEEQYYLYLVELFSTDQSISVPLWLVQEHLIKAKQALYKTREVVYGANHQSIVLSSTPNNQGIFIYTLMQIEPQPRIITLSEQEVRLSKTQLSLTQGRHAKNSIVWWQDQTTKHAGKIQKAHSLENNLLYEITPINEHLNNWLPEIVYVKEQDIKTPKYQPNMKVKWKLTAKDLQTQQELSGTGTIGPQSPTWVEGYLYKILPQQPTDTEPPFLVPEENIEAR